MTRIVSGGQTGVDRAALDVALALGIPCGGWCPRGRRAVDGAIPSRYPLQETRSADYRERTRLNVLDADGTLILNIGKLAGGTAYTVDVAEENDKPFLVIQLDEAASPGKVIDWVVQNNIHVLNVAGPRDDGQQQVHGLAAGFLSEAASSFLAAGFLAGAFFAAGFLSSALASSFLAAGFFSAAFLSSDFLASAFAEDFAAAAASATTSCLSLSAPSTSSMTAMGALSPRRLPTFVMRV